MKEKVVELIKKAVVACSLSDTQIKLEYPEDPEHGDLSCNIALVRAKELKVLPKELAEKIKAQLEKTKPDFIKEIQIAGPGFINFHLKDECFIAVVGDILRQKESYGSNDALKKQKTIIEFTDPNPFKEFHIGHLMSNTIGESISRLVEANGAEVKRACYQGDVGLHVAKAIANFLDKEKDKDEADYLKEADLNGLALGVDYVAGNRRYESEEGFKTYADEINRKLYERSDPKVNETYEAGKKKSLEYFDRLYEMLGTRFDYFFFESEVAGFGMKTVEENIGKVFEKSEGAVVFRAEKTNKRLHTRVFINSNGLPTYEAKELGLAKIKYDRFSYEKSIVITGNEINDYFKVLLAAMKLIFPDLAKKTLHIGHGMLRLPSGKMSSRTGKVIAAETLINDVKRMVLEKVKDRDYSKDEEERISEIIAIGAIKYSILRQAIGGDIIFNFDKSISFEGDSGPYLQYAYVRARSVLEKAAENGSFKQGGTSEFKSPPGFKTGQVERLLERFPSIVERAGKEYAPHLVVTYLTELAGAFNSWYAREQIMDEKDPAGSVYKIGLTEAVSIVMKNGLDLLGIKVPEKM